MAWPQQPYFPMGYQPYQPQMQPQMQPYQQTEQQTKYVEAVPVDQISEAENCPLAAGTSRLFFARDDSFVAVKAAGINGQITFTVYDRRPPAPQEPTFDPSAYLRKDEAEKLVERILAAREGAEA